MIIARPEGNNLPRYVLISFYTASAKNIKLHLVNVALFSHMAIENRKLKLNISKKKAFQKIMRGFYIAILELNSFCFIYFMLV